MNTDPRVIILAPMVRGSERAFRELVRRHGVHHCYSPMLRAAAVVQAYENVWKDCGGGGGARNDYDDNALLVRLSHDDGCFVISDLCRTDDEKGRLTVQLCGCQPNDCVVHCHGRAPGNVVGAWQESTTTLRRGSQFFGLSPKMRRYRRVWCLFRVRRGRGLYQSHATGD